MEIDIWLIKRDGETLIELSFMFELKDKIEIVFEVKFF